ncbi:MAG: C40 family peptidase [Bacteroidales bacterium]|nr:C40 family peptidase [Bacteroidales bacterium]
MKRLLSLVLLLAGLTAAAQTTQNQYVPNAVINISTGFLRAEPDYEAPLETQALMGTPVQVIDSTSYWRKVVAPDYTAWINVLGLAPIPQGFVASPKYICTTEFSLVYAQPSAKAERISELLMGDLLRIGGKRRNGFRSVLLADDREGWVRTKDVEEFSKWAASRKPTAANIIATAKRFTGFPYLWGGNSTKGFDCSGLLKLAFFMNGILLPRNSSQLVKLGVDLDVSHVLDGDFSTLIPGDLLFFGNRDTGRVTHVALYIGGGKIIQASQVVRINTLTGNGPDQYENAWRLLYGRRILGTPDAMPLTKSPYYFVQD